MRKFGRRSRQVLGELDPRLQRIMVRVLDEVADISLICGFRNQADQNAAYLDGASSVVWPNSKHNKFPALAVDFQPFPLPHEEVVLWAGLAYIAGSAIRIAKEEGVTLRWGGDWNRNGSVSDERFHDLFHLEIVD